MVAKLVQRTDGALHRRRTRGDAGFADGRPQLRSAPPTSFDQLFVQLMTVHHAGAVAMADKELRGNGDIRLRIMAHAICHEQQGEIALMRGSSGLKAVTQAVRNMFADNINAAR
jgi:uncharacterized protein (DUF305 family)